MIDYVSVEVPNIDLKRLLNNPLLDWKATISNETGEVINYYTIWGQLFFKITKLKTPILKIRNSLPIFWQGSNYKDYTFNTLVETLSYLQSKFDFNLNDANIHSLEVGVNIKTPVPPKEILTGYLQYKTTPFQPMRGKGKSLGIECELSQFKIKVYDKGEQCRLRFNLMRFEIRIKKIQYLNRTHKITLTTLEDLTKRESLITLERVLFSVYDSILKAEKIPLKDLNRNDRDIILSGRSSTYWQGLKEWNRNTYKSKLKRFKEIQNQYKKDSIHDKVRGLILSKWRELLNNKKSNQTSPIFTTFESVLNETPNHPYLPFTHNVTLDESQFEKLRCLSPLQVFLFEERKCVMCESDISAKRRDAKTCSKRCRNKKSNHYQNKLRKMNVGLRVPLLFGQSKYLSLNLID